MKIDGIVIQILQSTEHLENMTGQLKERIQEGHGIEKYECKIDEKTEASSQVY